MTEQPETNTSEAWRWMSFAEDDLKGAIALLGTDAPARLACFHSQQAAEKAVKAILVLHEIEPPRTHNLLAIAGALPAHLKLPINDEDLGDLSSWAVEHRYPGDQPTATPQEAGQAVTAATSIVEAMKGHLEHARKPTEPERSGQ